MDFLHKEEKLEDRRKDEVQKVHTCWVHPTNEAGCCGIKIVTV